MNWIKDDSIPTNYIKKIASLLNIKELIAKIILKRKNDENFLKNITISLDKAIIPPYKLYNADKIAKRISWYIEHNSIIFIHADYDSDGINSGKIMYSVIDEIITSKNYNSKVEVYFPERKNGYGLSLNFCNELISNKANKKYKQYKNILVITVDNGIAQVNEIKLLKNNNIETLVVDHHESKDIIPDCIICDPHNHHVKQDDTFKHLCGAGVAFKVCELLQSIYNISTMINYLPYLAVATITDMMPLNDENIAFIKYGLNILNSDTCPENYKKMISSLKADGTISSNKVTPTNIGWDIGPRINSCGRMGHTDIAGKFILSNDSNEIEMYVKEIEKLNKKRKDITNAIKEDIKKNNNFSNKLFIIHVLEDCPEGIAGIICSYITQEYKKPCIVVNEHNGIYVGSARTIEGLDILKLLVEAYDNKLLLKCGGHKDAAGVSFDIKDLNKLDDFLNKKIKSLGNEVLYQNENSLNQNLHVDEIINFRDLNKDNYDSINEFPFNNTDFKKPIFAVVNCKVIKANVQKSNNKNIWLTLEQDGTTIEFWCRNLADIYINLGCPRDIDIVGHLIKNFMQGKREYTMEILDIKTSIGRC